MGDFSEKVSRETLERLRIYEQLLVSWQQKTNLIGSGTTSDIWNRHILDSFQVAELVFGHGLKAPTLVDIGTGAGLPGLIIAIAMAEHGGGHVHLVESNGKKCAFLRTALSKLDLPKDISVVVHNQRIESALPKIQLCHFLTARALTSLAGLLDFRLLLPQPNVICYFQKGANVDSEIEAARKTFDFQYNLIPSSLAHDSVVLEIEGILKR